MKNIKFYFTLFIILIINNVLYSQNKTTELIDTNSDKIPTFLWEYSGIGNGYSSATIAMDKVFITGEIDNIGYLFALDKNGNLLWKKPYGTEWTKNYKGSRASPTYADDFIYVCSGLGKITCFEIETGNTEWSVDMIEDYGGENLIFGYSMDLLIDDNLLYCFPGGYDHNIIALNSLTGKLVWTTRGQEELSSYASPILIKLENLSILAIFSEFSLLGFDAKTGDFLWLYALDEYGEIPCNAPIYENGYIYYAEGNGNGAAKIKLSEDGKTISKIWNNVDFDTYFGGIIIIDNYMYGTTNKKRNFSCLDLKTGEIQASLKLGKGAVVASVDKIIYYYSEKGQVNTIVPNDGNPQLIDSFRIKKGTQQHFAHPVINDNNLYIRHGNSILVYQIKKK